MIKSLKGGSKAHEARIGITTADEQLMDSWNDTHKSIRIFETGGNHE
ncbi:MAG: hypothetical protein PHX21_05865 [bacterium]|nr:hypothetical protein [bacterium]